MQQPAPQKTWGWSIAAYLFLAGAGAGGYLTSFAAEISGTTARAASSVGVLLGGPLVLVGMAFLILDLGVKNNAWKAFANVRTSWMARGAWIISAFALLDAFQLSSSVFHFPWPVAAGALAAALALATMFYTGFLLKACRPISFWNTIILPVLFLISASSTGVMLVVLGSIAYGGTATSLSSLSRSVVYLILVEALIMVAFLGRGQMGRSSRGSVRMWTRGPLAALFWGGVVTCGLLVPMLSELYLPVPSLLSVGMLFGLAGGLLLRRIVLAAGVREPLIDPASALRLHGALAPESPG